MATDQARQFKLANIGKYIPAELQLQICTCQDYYGQYREPADPKLPGMFYCSGCDLPSVWVLIVNGKPIGISHLQECEMCEERYISQTIPDEMLLCPACA